MECDCGGTESRKVLKICICLDLKKVKMIQEHGFVLGMSGKHHALSYAKVLQVIMRWSTACLRIKSPYKRFLAHDCANTSIFYVYSWPSSRQCEKKKHLSFPQTL